MKFIHLFFLNSDKVSSVKEKYQSPILSMMGRNAFDLNQLTWMPMNEISNTESKRGAGNADMF